MKKKIKKGEIRNKEKKKQNKLMSKKHETVFTSLNYIENLKKLKYCIS